jgi:hypothetical protein
MLKIATALVTFTLFLGVLPLGARARAPQGCDVRRALRAEHGRAAARIEFETVGPRGRARRGDRISGEARELRVVVEYRGLQDIHAQRLALYTPDGSLFRRFTTTFSARGRVTAVPTVVPVAGTAMTDAGLFGEWCAEVLLDDDDTPVVARSFDLVQPR